jgi:hypothetical protein
MAETNIVQSLFGPTPYEVEQARRQQASDYAAKVANMNNIQQAKFGIGQGAAAIAGEVGGMFGLVDPMVEQAKAREQALTNIDLSNSDAILRTAMRTQDPRMKVQLTMMAQQRKAQEQAQMLAAQKAMREDKMLEFKQKEEYELKKSESEARIRQNDERIADARTSAAERAALQRENNQIKLMLGQGMLAMKQLSLNTGVAGGVEPTPEEVDFYAQMAMSGDQSWRVGLGRSKDGVALIRAVDRRMPELAKEVGMTPDAVVANKQEVVTRQKVLKDFSTGTQGQLVNSFNTAIDHLDTLKELGNALNNGNLQLANKIKNTAAAWTGDADITNLDTAKQIVGAEVIKSIVARGGGQAEREEAANRISRISSPAQLAGYIDTTQKLMAGQLKSLEQQYSTGTKRKDFKEKLLPRAKNVLESLSGSASSDMVSQIPTSAPTAARKYNPATGRIE